MRTRSGEGWGQLPRAIARALAGTDLKEYESKLIWAIVYKTIAFNKLEDRIPQSQFVALTGIDQRNISRTIKGLLNKGIIFKQGSVYGIQRDITKWKNTSPQAYTKEIHLRRVKNTSQESKNTSPETHSRDLSKRTNQERVFSKPPGGKKEREVPEGFKNLMKDIGNMPGFKK